MALGQPNGFPDQYWLPVVAAEAAARAKLLPALDRIGWHRAPTRFLDWTAVKKAVAEYLIAVIGEFADQACLAVRAGVFPPLLLDRTIESFIEIAIHQAYVGLGHEKILATWSSSHRTIGDDLRPQVLAAAWHGRYLAEVPNILQHVAQGSAGTRHPDGPDDKSRLRNAVVRPLLKVKGLSVPQWAGHAGVNQAVAYDYLNGKSDPRPENRKALAGALGLEPGDLPD